MSVRVYPPRVGTVQTLGVSLRYPSPWVQVSAKIHKNWKLVIQEVEQLRLHQALKAKRNEAVCILSGIVLGCG